MESTTKKKKDILNIIKLNILEQKTITGGRDSHHVDETHGYHDDWNHHHDLDNL